MALTATGLVYWDPSAGSNDYAGYFDPSMAGAGTNYPAAQAAPILSPTDLACTSGSTTVTSATGGFTAAMVGNGLWITGGTNFVAGLYVITGRTDANTITVDQTPVSGGDGTSGTGNVAGRRAVWTDAVWETYVPGITNYVLATATMTLTEALNIAIDGTAVAPISVFGMTSAGALNPTGDNRPLIDCGGYAALGSTATFWRFRDLRITTTATNGFFVGNSSNVRNCKVTNTSTTTGRKALMTSAYAIVTDCELSSSYGQGLSLGASASVLRTYVHDCNQGAGTREGIALGNACTLLECIVDTCTVAVQAAAVTGGELNRCTLYSGTTGIDASTAYSMILENNVVASFTTGLDWDTATPLNVWQNNDIWDCGTDRVNVAAGTGDNDVDPSFTDAANGDFSLASGSGILDTGIGMALGVG